MKPKEQRRVAIYVRVSRDSQDTNMQENEVKEFVLKRGFTLHKVYRDHAESGIKRHRPALDELLADCRKRRFDVLGVWRLDRLARSLPQLLSILELCNSLGVQFLSVNDSLDTTTPAGVFCYQVFGAVAEFERNLLAERVRAGLREARRQGKRVGRPAVALSDDQIKRIRRERAQKSISIRKLARKYGLSSSRVHLLCKGRRAV